MLQRAVQTAGRIILILLVAGAISGSVYAAANSLASAGQVMGFARDFGGQPRVRGDSRSASQKRVPPLTPAGTTAPDQGFGRPDDTRNRNSPSLVRGLPDLITNIVVIGILIWLVSRIEKRTKRRKRRATAQAVG